MTDAPTLFTVGHSSAALEDLQALLAEARIQLLVDVRRFPSSRRYPWFAGPALAASLKAAGVEYRHEPDLGGHRKLRGGDANAGLEHEAFRAYADHMANPAFRNAERRLRQDARTRRVVVMCAEADPANCHRKLLADHVTAFGLPVVHLLHSGGRAVHRPTPCARLGGDGVLRYPDLAGKQLDLFDS